MRTTLNAEAAEKRRAAQSRKSLRPSAFLCGLCVKWVLPGLLIVAVSLWAAGPPPASRVRGFRVPQFFESPHETKMKSLLEGAEAEPQPGGLIRIANFRLQTFNEQGENTMTVRSPHCIFDSTKQTVSSDGPLEVRTTDGKLLVEGEG